MKGGESEYRLALHVIVKQAVEIEKLKDRLATAGARIAELEAEAMVVRQQVKWRGRR